MERRKSEPNAAATRKITLSQGDKSWTGRLVDASEHGLCIGYSARTRNVARSGEATVSLEFAELETPYVAACTIQWARRAFGGARVGVEFSEPDEVRKTLPRNLHKLFFGNKGSARGKLKEPPTAQVCSAQPGASREWIGKMQDMSAKGLVLLISAAQQDAFPVGTKVGVRIRLPELPEMILMHARVDNVQRQREDRAIYVHFNPSSRHFDRNQDAIVANLLERERLELEKARD
jgi:hypothetical protein